MRTFEEIKAEIIASNPSRVYFINGESFEQTDEEFAEAVHNKALSILAKEEFEKAKAEAEAEAAAKKAAAEAKLAALGLTADDLKALGLGGN